MVVLASRRVLVAQFCKSHSVDNYRNSDPFMALVPPAAQYTDVYHFMTVSTRSGQTSYSNFLNLMCETSKLPGLRLNNAPIPHTAAVLHWGWASVPTTSVSVASLSIPNGTYTLSHVEPNVTFGAMLYGLQFQESYGQLLGQRLRTLTYAEICLSLQAEQEDYFDNDCDGLFDEEIENGVDDDGDGLIDEDVFNDRMARPQTGDNSSLYYTAVPRVAGEGNGDNDVTTTDSPPTSTVPVPTTDPVTTEQATTQPAPTTTTQPTTTEPPTTTPPTSEAATTTQAATTELLTTTEQAVIQLTTAGSPSTTGTVTTQEATTLPVTTTALDTTTHEATTLPDTTLRMSSTVEVTTADVTTVTTEGPSTPVVTTELTTETATTPGVTTEPPLTTTEPPTTERQTTTVEPVTTPIVTTEHHQTTVQQDPSSAAVTTDALTTEQDTRTGAASTAAATTRQQQDSSTDPVTHSPLLEVLSTSSRPQPSTARGGTTAGRAPSTADPDTGRDFTTEVPSLEQPVSPSPTGRSVSTLPEDQLKLVIPALILLGIPLIVLTVLITRSCKAAKRARLAAQQGGSPTPPPPPPPPASFKSAAKAPAKHKTGVVDLR